MEIIVVVVPPWAQNVGERLGHFALEIRECYERGAWSIRVIACNCYIRRVCRLGCFGVGHVSDWTMDLVVSILKANF